MGLQPKLMLAYAVMPAADTDSSPALLARPILQWLTGLLEAQDAERNDRAPAAHRWLDSSEQRQRQSQMTVIASARGEMRGDVVHSGSALSGLYQLARAHQQEVAAQHRSNGTTSNSPCSACVPDLDNLAVVRALVNYLYQQDMGQQQQQLKHQRGRHSSDANLLQSLYAYAALESGPQSSPPAAATHARVEQQEHTGLPYSASVHRALSAFADLEAAACVQARGHGCTASSNVAAHDNGSGAHNVDLSAYSMLSRLRSGRLGNTQPPALSGPLASGKASSGANSHNGQQELAVLRLLANVLPQHHDPT